jgi:urea-proton symporter
MLAGNVVALLSPLIFIPVLTFAFGKQNYDWESMKQIRRGDDSDLAAAAHIDLELTPGATIQSEETEAAEQAKLKKAALIARSLTVFMTLALLVVWPMPMYGSGYIFSKKFFTGEKPPYLISDNLMLTNL